MSFFPIESFVALVRSFLWQAAQENAKETMSACSIVTCLKNKILCRRQECRWEVLRAALGHALLGCTRAR